MTKAPTGSAKDHQWFWDGLDQYLARKKLKQTKQRKAIVEHFLRRNDHVDVEDLYENVRRDGHHIGLATIYRTMNLLKDACLVTQNNFSDGRSVYELLEPGSHHDHLVCTKCNRVVEFESESIENAQREIAARNGFVLTSHRLDLFGICASCAKK